MSGKYSDSRFFFAHYGCCIPTESYAWILVVLFITTVLVLLFCMLATATIRWMYKRRMRKRLHDLKHKYQMDQLKAQEFEEKLNFMAQKNKSFKTLDGYDSKDGKSEKLTIFVDPAQNYAQQNSTKKKKALLYDPKKSKMIQAPIIYDRDETPIAQSTLASQSTTKVPKDRWFMPQQHQKGPLRPLVKEPVAPAQVAPVFQAPPPLPLESPQKLPTDTTPTNTEGVSPIINPNQKSPLKKNSKELAPPLMTSTSGISEFTTASTPMTTTTETTTPITGSTGTTGVTFGTTGTTEPTGTTGTTQTTGPTGTSGTTAPSTGNPETTPLTGTTNANETAPPNPNQNYSSNMPVKNGLVISASDEKQNSSPGDSVKANLQYGQDDIVSPRVSDKTEDRKEGAGGKSEWKYYYAHMSDPNGKRRPSSSITKSSTSNRPSSNSWVFDSTGSNRFEAVQQGTSSSSSIIKTDSSQYKTASIESFPHGAFAFQQ